MLTLDVRPLVLPFPSRRNKPEMSFGRRLGSLEANDQTPYCSRVLS